MRSSKRSKKSSPEVRSSLHETGTEKGKDGQSEKPCPTPQENGSVSLTQTETFKRGNCISCSFLQNLFRLWLVKNDIQSLQALEELSHFQRGYLLSFCLGCPLIRRRESNYSKPERSVRGKKTGGSSTSKSFGLQSKEAIESARYL